MIGRGGDKGCRGGAAIVLTSVVEHVSAEQCPWSLWSGAPSDCTRAPGGACVSPGLTPAQLGGCHTQ